MSSFSIPEMQHFWKWTLHWELVYTLSWLEHAHFITQSQHGAIYISCTFVGSWMLCGLILIWSQGLKAITKCFIHPHRFTYLEETCFSPLGLCPFYNRVIPCGRNYLQVMGDFGRIDIPMCDILVKMVLLSIINQLYSIVILLKWRRAHLLWISKDLNSWSN